MCSTMKVVGLMSGTSADGIDAALVEIEDRDSGLKAETLAFGNYHYPERVREKIFELFSPKRLQRIEYAGSTSCWAGSLQMLRFL